MRRPLAGLLALLLLAAGGAAWWLSRPEPTADTALAESVPSALPGAPPMPAELAAQLAAHGHEGSPRTRHLTETGAPRYTNRLALESSPYLRQHAHNPVNWYPWGEEAFADAVRLDRPILLSVGYATCHWCHVMEEESFEDVGIAELINRHYIPVKVDREERPDVDAVYMTAVIGFTGGRGGWPTTLWLTPDGEPFYGATYLPPEDGMRGRPTGLRTMLERLATLYAEEPAKVALTTASVRDSIARSLEAHETPAELPEDADGALLAAVSDRYDAEHGGIARTPKFPSHVPLRALLRGSPEAAEMATHTLEAMAAGGLYDQLGGGFHRYATDAEWTVPHFEKMLADNALLAIAYTEAAQQAGDAGFERVARDTLDAMLRDFALADGGFASAIDADSLAPSGERVEGAYYTWTPAELADVLSPAQAKAFAAAYGVTERGQLEGRSVLHTEGLLGVDVHDAHAEAREALLAARGSRPAPLRDDKVLAGHNGLAVSALARAGRTFGEPRYIEAAEQAAAAVWERQVVDGRVKRVWTPAGGAEHMGQLEDYAFLAAGFVDLFEATGERRWLERAIALDEAIQAHFADPATGGYFATPDDGEQLLARKRASVDAAEPSGASVHALTLLRLGELTGRDGYRDRAVALVQAQGEALVREPLAYGELHVAADWLLDTPREIVLIGEGDEAEVLRDVLREHFLPTAVFVDVTPEQARGMEDLTSLVRDRTALGGEATVYVCEGGVCQQPVTEPETLREQLRAK